jgi:WD repeat-containing protein 19
MVNLQETVKILSLPDQAAIKNVDWSSDGQLLAVTTAQGQYLVFNSNRHSLILNTF